MVHSTGISACTSTPLKYRSTAKVPSGGLCRLYIEVAYAVYIPNPSTEDKRPLYK
jgi:hypothetical protein